MVDNLSLFVAKVHQVRGKYVKMRSASQFRRDVLVCKHLCLPSSHWRMDIPRSGTDSPKLKLFHTGLSTQLALSPKESVSLSLYYNAF